MKLKKFLKAALALILFLFIVGFVLNQKEVTLLNGGKTTHLKTRAKTVKGFLRESGINLKAEDKVKPDRETRIKEEMVIEVKKAIPLVFETGSQKVRVKVAATTVGEALEELGIRLGEEDKVIPGPKKPLVKESHIKIEKARSKLEIVKQPLPFPVVTEADGLLLAGRSQVINPGKEGEMVQIFEVFPFNEAKKVLKSEKVVSSPTPKLVKIGTKAPSPRPPSNPREKDVTRMASLGVSRGSGRTMIMRATAYAPGYGAGTITATGRRAGYGLVAVDPRVIPLGTRLYIEGYGEAIAADTGGAIKGNRIDLGYNSGAEAINFGRRQVTVQILE